MPSSDKEKRRQQKRLWRAKNIQRIREYQNNHQRMWYCRHKEVRQRINRQYRKKAAVKLRNEVIELLGGACCKCGFSDQRALQVDHIHRTENGIPATQLERKPAALYARIIKSNNTSDFQLLCANCHAIKTRENKDYLPIEIQKESQKIPPLFVLMESQTIN